MTFPIRPGPGASAAGALLVASLALGGCVPAPASAPPPAVEAAGGGYVYTCPDGYRFGARFRSDSAVVELPGRSLVLPRVLSADGARYEAEGVELWTKGMQASLESGAETRRGCEAVRADDPWEAARLLGVDFRAVGQEPGWTLDLVRGRAVRYVGDYGSVRVVAPAPEPERDAAGSVTYRVRTEAHDLTVVIRPTPCEDVMSGEAFPHTVAVRLDGRSLEGCGRELSTGEATGRDWRLVELGGSPAVAGIPGREPYLRLDAGGSRVTGSTGCNTFGGPYELSGDQLRFGELISTRMACVDPAAARQERALVSALDTTERFTISGDRLTLYAGDRPLAAFRAGPRR